MPYTKSSLTDLDRFILIVLFLTLHVLLSFGIKSYGIVSILFVMAYCYYFSNYKLFRKMAFSFPMIIWIVLTLYHWVNAMYKYVPEVNIIDLLHGFKIYACIVLICFYASIDLKKTLQTLIIAYTLTLFIFILQAGVNLRGGSATAWSTEIGQRAAVLAVFIIYYSIIKNRGVANTILWLLIPLAFVVMSQTRNALGMIIIMFVGYLYVYIYKGGRQKTNRLIIAIFFGSIFLFFFLMFFSDTDLSTRFAEGSNYQGSYFYRYHAGALKGTVLDKIVGDRLSYYVLGWQLFVKNIWTGIGMWNFKYIVGGVYPLHSEYMIHLCEGGIIGFVLWLAFVIYVIYGLLKIKDNDKMKYLGLFAVMMLLFCGIYAREFYYEFFYPIYGIVLYHIYASKNKNVG